MALDDFLVHRCTIQRAPNAEETPTRGSSGEALKVFADHITLLPCRLVVQDERMASPSGFLFATTYRLIIPANRDVRAGDRVSEVVMDDLSTQGPFTIESVIPRLARSSQHHITMRLEKVK